MVMEALSVLLIYLAVFSAFYVYSCLAIGLIVGVSLFSEGKAYELGTFLMFPMPLQYLVPVIGAAHLIYTVLTTL